MRGCGLRLTRILVIPVALYYFLASAVARRASIDYLERVTKPEALNPAGIIRLSIAHFISFAQSIADRVYVWQRGVNAFPLCIDNPELLEKVFAKNDAGGLILVSHLGNFDIAMSCLKSNPRRVCNIVMSEPHIGLFNRFRNRLSGLTNVRFVDAGGINLDSAMALIDRVGKGEIVVVAADRSFELNAERTASVKFLGADARFPIGPYILGHVLKVPVYTLFAFRDGGVYNIRFNLFAERIVLRGSNRTAELHKLAQCYVRILEKHCRHWPLQWYNFHDSWM